MATPTDVASAHYAQRSTYVASAAAVAAQQWAQVDPAAITASWLARLPELTAVVTGAQLAAAQAADAYTTAALVAQSVPPAAQATVVAAALAGVASDGLPLASLLYQPAVTALRAIGAGQPVDRALASGYAALDMIVRTQVSDAGRAADQVALVTRPAATGYVRMVVGETCGRCIVLAGRRYTWNAGFDRHPRCNCVGIPAGEDVAGDLRTDPRKAFDAMTRDEQDKAFTLAGAQAIRDGADIGQVVNARRGMASAGITRTGLNADGQVVNLRHRTLTGGATTSSTTRRGQTPGRARLMPEAIYRMADGDRTEALRLLRLHRYIL